MLKDMPGNSIVIVGAGYISVEFASIFRGFGADVHLMYRKPLPLTGWAPQKQIYHAARARTALGSPIPAPELGDLYICRRNALKPCTTRFYCL